MKTSAPHHLAGLLLASTLAGCTGYGPSPTSDPLPGAAGAAPAAPVALCNARGAQFSVGHNSTGSIVESARSRSGAQMARVVRPGQMVTKEFDAQRLNLQVDASGRIVSVNCG